MTTKNRPPTAEETDFLGRAQQTDRLLWRQCFSSFDDKTLRDPHGLVFSKGSKQTTLQSDIPFNWTRRQKSLIV